MATEVANASLDVERAVRERYSEAAQRPVAALCCAVDYDPAHLKAIPEEVIERDYGCGDPSRYVREGDTVLDLGSGSGKICMIASQIVGPRGRVIGVDMNDEMLELSRRAAPVLAERIGYDNLSFRRGRIQDLTLDLDRVATWLESHPVRDLADLAALDAHSEELRRDEPLIPDASVDIVVSNCVLNLVREEDKSALIRELFRVLRVGGRVAVSDIVSDEAVPEAARRDPELWSGCVSGAFQERALLGELEAAGFHGIAIDQWSEEPFAVVAGVEFRAVTLTASKGKQGPCLEANQAVVYKGPWKQVEDDDGHVLQRGERTAVCEKTFRLLTSEPYAGQCVPISPRVPISDAERRDFDCSRARLRDPRETKGEAYQETRTGSADCCPPGSCD